MYAMAGRDLFFTERREHGTEERVLAWNQDTWVLFPALPLTGCLPLSKLLGLSVSLLPFPPPALVHFRQQVLRQGLPLIPCLYGIECSGYPQRK